MNVRTTIKLLVVVCVAEATFIGFLLWPKTIVVVPQVQVESVAAETKPLGNGSPVVVPVGMGEGPATQVELTKRNVALETELAEVKKELDTRKSEISFSYGSVRDSGRFVGMTFRKMFETAAARESTEVQARMADNQINVLSLGPFIQDAEVMESDPLAFAQFQAPLISEVLGLPPEKGTEVESLLQELKTQSLKLEEGSPEWVALNDTAFQKVTGMLSPEQKIAMKRQIDFFQQYGVLVIPAYSILRAPTPTVASP